MERGAAELKKKSIRFYQFSYATAVHEATHQFFEKLYAKDELRNYKSLATAADYYLTGEPQGTGVSASKWFEKPEAVERDYEAKLIREAGEYRERFKEENNAYELGLVLGKKAKAIKEQLGDAAGRRFLCLLSRGRGTKEAREQVKKESAK